MNLGRQTVAYTKELRKQHAIIETLAKEIEDLRAITGALQEQIADYEAKEAKRLESREAKKAAKSSKK